MHAPASVIMVRHHEMSKYIQVSVISIVRPSNKTRKILNSCVAKPLWKHWPWTVVSRCCSNCVVVCDVEAFATLGTFFNDISGATLFASRCPLCSLSHLACLRWLCVITRPACCQDRPNVTKRWIEPIFSFFFFKKAVVLFLM